MTQLKRDTLFRAYKTTRFNRMKWFWKKYGYRQRFYLTRSDIFVAFLNQGYILILLKCGHPSTTIITLSHISLFKSPDDTFLILLHCHCGNTSKCSQPFNYSSKIISTQMMSCRYFALIFCSITLNFTEISSANLRLYFSPVSNSMKF